MTEVDKGENAWVFQPLPLVISELDHILRVHGSPVADSTAMLPRM